MCRDSGQTHQLPIAVEGIGRIEVAGETRMLDTGTPARTGAGVAPTPVSIGHGSGGRQAHHVRVDQGL